MLEVIKLKPLFVLISVIYVYNVLLVFVIFVFKAFDVLFIFVYNVLLVFVILLVKVALLALI